MIITTEDKGIVNFHWCNRKYIGYAYREVDGYYVFDFSLNQGFWSAYPLRAIADKLDELNAAWDEQVRSHSKNINDTEEPQKW